MIFLRPLFLCASLAILVLPLPGLRAESPKPVRVGIPGLDPCGAGGGGIPGRFFDLAQPSEAQINAADIADGTINDFGTSARPLNGNPYGAYYVLQENSTGKSNYNALQVSYRITGESRAACTRQ